MTAIPSDIGASTFMEQARRDRATAREADRRLRTSAAEGSRLPTADQLLRGHPFLGCDIATDILGFVAAASSEASDRDALGSLQRLELASREQGPNGRIDEAGILEALVSCRFDETSDPDGTIRLRCVIYAAVLGDIDAMHGRKRRRSGSATIAARAADFVRAALGGYGAMPAPRSEAQPSSRPIRASKRVPLAARGSTNGHFGFGISSHVRALRIQSGS